MNHELLRQLYQKYQKEIYLYLYSLCRNKELAEDLRQETFLKAILSLPENHGNMRAWLYMVARNLYFNYRNHEKRNLIMEKPDELQKGEEISLLERILQDEKKQVLYEALQHLPMNKREILILYYFGGLSQKEIAAILKQTSENIRIQAYRGKKQLREYLEVNGYDIS